MTSEEINNENVIKDEPKQNTKITSNLIIAIFVIIALTAGTTYVFTDTNGNGTKQTINMGQYPVSGQIVNTTALPPSPVTQTTLDGNVTHVALKNGIEFNDNSNLATIGKMIQANETYYKTTCQLVLYYSNTTVINDVFDTLSKNNYIINATKNPNCDNSIRHMTSSVRLVP